MIGSMKAAQIREGVPRGRFRLRQRRVRARTFGEPGFEAELVPEAVCAAQPHILAWLAWSDMRAVAGADDKLDLAQLDIYSAYRSVALQRQVWEYRLEERRAKRVSDGLPPLPERDLERQQRKWTAKPGQSAHHTGLALDLGLYHQGKRASLRAPEYAWLAAHASAFGFYPYLPEAWHWEYNPPGLVAALAQWRAAMAAGEDASDGLRRCRLLLRPAG